jgi:integrase
MQRFRTPSLRRHKASCQGIVTLNGTDHYLGPWPSTSRAAPVHIRQAYDRLIAEWYANGRQPPQQAGIALTVVEVIARFWEFVNEHYRRPDGTATSEPVEFKNAFRPLNHLYADLPANQFSPLKLEAVRRLMVDGYLHPRYGKQIPLSRGVVNQRVDRIRRLFKWSVAKELVAPEVHHALQAVTGLQRGRCKARETEPIKPVPQTMVDAVLPFVAREVAAMVQIQRLTGMRPGEVCILRACDIDMSGDVWLYRPAYHKLAYRGRERVIAIGPRGQEIIKPFLRLETQAFLFSPRHAQEQRFAEMREKRKTPVQPSQTCRRKRKPKKQPKERYTTSSYEHAVRAGCDKAFPPPEPLTQDRQETASQWQARLTQAQKDQLRTWQRQHRWQPNQIRHSHATEVRRRFGLEAAQVALGHSQATITQSYAERDTTLAVKVAAAMG